MRAHPALVLILSLAGTPLAAAPRGGRIASAGPVQLNCDLLSFSGDLDKATERDLTPAHSLDAAAAVLVHHNVPFQRARGTLSYGDMPKKLYDNLNALPAGEPIILPNETGGAICVLVPSADSY